jgi:hypothetical protein
MKHVMKEKKCEEKRKKTHSAKKGGGRKEKEIKKLRLGRGEEKRNEC